MRKPRSAYESAVRFLAARNHSRRELERKLLRKFDPDEVSQALSRVEQQGYLDDRAFAIQRAKSLRMRKRWGDLRIASDLANLGIADSLAEAALLAVNAEHPQEDALTAAVEAWLRLNGRPKSMAQVKRLFESCIRLGYPGEAVRRRIGPFLSEAEWDSQPSPPLGDSF